MNTAQDHSTSNVKRDVATTSVLAIRTADRPTSVSNAGRLAAVRSCAGPLVGLTRLRTVPNSGEASVEPLVPRWRLAKPEHTAVADHDDSARLSVKFTDGLGASTTAEDLGEARLEFPAGSLTTDVFPLPCLADVETEGKMVDQANQRRCGAAPGEFRG